MLTNCDSCGKPDEARRMMRMAPNGVKLQDAQKICPTCIVRHAMDFEERGNNGCLHCENTAKMLRAAVVALEVYEETGSVVAVPIEPTGVKDHALNCPIR